MDICDLRNSYIMCNPNDLVASYQTDSPVHMMVVITGKLDQ